VCSVWVPCVALPSGGGSSVGPSPLCGSPVGVPCVVPLCGSPLCGSPEWVPCGGLSSRRVASCGIYSRDVSRSFTRSRSCMTYTREVEEGSAIAQYSSRALALQQCGQCKWAGGRKGRLIRAQTTPSKRISCHGQAPMRLPPTSGKA